MVMTGGGGRERENKEDRRSLKQARKRGSNYLGSRMRAEVEKEEVQMF